MLFNTAPEKFWNMIAKKYAASPVPDRPAYDTKIAKIKTHLDANMAVLDIGCATGTQCGDIAGDVRQVTGIDISSKLLAIAEQRMTERGIDNVEFLLASPFDDRLQPASFDVLMAFHVLHFFEDTDVILERFASLLKPGGLFISETGCIGDRDRFLGVAIRTAGYLGLLPKITLLKDQQLQAAIVNAGFDIVDKTKFSQQPDAEFTYLTRKS